MGRTCHSRIPPEFEDVASLGWAATLAALALSGFPFLQGTELNVCYRSILITSYTRQPDWRSAGKRPDIQPFHKGEWYVHVKVLCI